MNNLKYEITKNYGTLHLLKMNKIVIANFISSKYTFSSNQILFNIPTEFSPNYLLEIPVTGIETPIIKGAINISKKGEIIFYTSNITEQSSEN